MNSPVDLIDGATSAVLDGITSAATGASRIVSATATGASRIVSATATGASHLVSATATGASHLVSATATGASHIVYRVFGTPAPLPTIRFTPGGEEGTVTIVEQTQEEPIDDFELVDAPTPAEMQALRAQQPSYTSTSALDAMQLNVEWALFDSLAPNNK